MHSTPHTLNAQNLNHDLLKQSGMIAVEASTQFLMDG